jgi:hypothetical protein
MNKKYIVVVVVLLAMMGIGIFGIAQSLKSRNSLPTQSQPTQTTNTESNKTDTNTALTSPERKATETKKEATSDVKPVVNPPIVPIVKQSFDYDISNLSDGILSDCKDTTTGLNSVKVELEVVSTTLNKKYIIVSGAGTTCAGNIIRPWKLVEISSDGSAKVMATEQLSKGGAIILSPNQDKLTLTSGSHAGACLDTVYFSVYDLNIGTKIYPTNTPIFSKSFSLNVDIPTRWIDNATIEYTSTHAALQQCQAPGFALSNTPLSLKI